MAGLPIAVIGRVGFAMLTGQDVHRWLPLGVLLWEARHADAARQQQVAAEVLRRYTADTLSPDQADAALAAALDIQGDVSRPWATEWGDLVETVKTDGKLSDEQQHRFQNQAAVLEWKVRPRVRAGDPIPIIATLTEARVGSSTMPGSESTRMVHGSITNFDADKVEVVLRPSRDAALLTLDLERIYGAQIVFKNVEIQFHQMNSGRVLTGTGGMKRKGGFNPFGAIQRLMGGP